MTTDVTYPGAAAASSSSHSSALASDDDDDRRPSVMSGLTRMSSVLACAMMRHLDQASYAAVSRCSTDWRTVARLPTATPCAVRFSGCWRAVEFERLEHLRPHRLEVVPDVTGRACARVQHAGDCRHCDWSRILPLIRSSGVGELVRTLRLSLSAHESAATVGGFVAALATMTRVTALRLHVETIDGVPKRAQSVAIADLIWTRTASLLRLTLSGAALAVGDIDRTVAAIGDCASLDSLALTVPRKRTIRESAWTRISRALPRLVRLRAVGVNAATAREFAAAVRGAVDAQYDPVPTLQDENGGGGGGGDSRDDKEPVATPERAFMQLRSLEIRTDTDVPKISLAPMPKLVRLKVVGGRWPEVRSAAAVSTATVSSTASPEVSTAAVSSTASPAVSTAAVSSTASQSLASQPETAPVVYRASRIAFDDREYRREVPSATPRTANLINDVPARDDPKRDYRSWTSLGELELGAIDLSGDELNRLPALRVLRLGAHVAVCHTFVWSLSPLSQLRRRASYLGRTADEQHRCETHDASASSVVAAPTTDESATPYRLDIIRVATREAADDIRRLGAGESRRSVKPQA